MDIATIGGFLGVVAVVAAAAVVVKGATSREALKWQKERIEQLEKDGAACKESITQLGAENRVLTEKVTQAAAVDALTKVLTQMLEENRSEHLQISAMIGAWRRQEGERGAV